MKRLILSLLVALALPCAANAESYQCFYEYQNKKESFHLKRKNNNFDWITKTDKIFKLSILTESPNEIVLGGEFYLSELNYYLIYFLDKKTLKLNSDYVVAPKYFSPNYYPKTKKLHQCFVSK